MIERVGQVEGPFRPGTTYIDGSRRPAYILTSQDKRRYWVVRVLHGTVLQDHRFYSLETAKAYWESLPAMT